MIEVLDRVRRMEVRLVWSGSTLSRRFELGGKGRSRGRTSDLSPDLASLVLLRRKTNKQDSDTPNQPSSLIRNYNLKHTYMYLVSVLPADCSQYFVTACSYLIHVENMVFRIDQKIVVVDYGSFHDSVSDRGYSDWVDGK